MSVLCIEGLCGTPSHELLAARQSWALQQAAMPESGSGARAGMHAEGSACPGTQQRTTQTSPLVPTSRCSCMSSSSTPVPRSALTSRTASGRGMPPCFALRLIQACAAQLVIRQSLHCRAASFRRSCSIYCLSWKCGGCVRTRVGRDAPLAAVLWPELAAGLLC